MSEPTSPRTRTRIKDKTAASDGGLNIPPHVREWARAGNRQERRIQADSPFKLPEYPPGVKPSDRSMAMDDAFSPVMNWAFQNSFGLSYTSGLGFIGYPALAEYAQQAEYRRISETLATEMTRKWIKITAAADTDKTDKIAKINKAMERLHVRDAFKTAALHDGLFGVAHLYLDFGTTDDPGELATDAGDGHSDISRSKVGRNKFNEIRSIEPLWCYPGGYNSTQPLAANYYRPQIWHVQGQPIHSSRLLTFIGRPVPDMLKPAYAFGGLSMTQMARPYVENWLRTRTEVSNLVASFSLKGLKLNLAEAMMLGGNKFAARMEFFTELMNNRGVMALNKEEEFFNTAVPLGTLDELQAQAQEHICSVAGIPLVKYTGITPHGLNASSEGEIRTFYDWINAYQNALFLRPLHAVFGFIQLSEFGEIDPDLSFEFEPLWSMSELEKSQVENNKANTDKSYIDCNVLNPDEVRTRVAADEDLPYAGLDLVDEPGLSFEQKSENATRMATPIIQAYEAGLIDKAHALAELAEAGILQTVTPEDIQAALEEPPQIGEEMFTDVAKQRVAATGRVDPNAMTPAEQEEARMQAGGPGGGPPGGGMDEGFDPTQPRDKTGEWTDSGAKEDVGAEAPKGTARVYRIGSEQGGLGGRNAGNLRAVATHMVNQADWEHPQSAGGEGTHLSAYEADIPDKVGEYQTSNARAAKINQVGRRSEKHSDGVYSNSYSFPNGFGGKKIGTVPIAEVNAELKKLGYSDADDAGTIATEKALRAVVARKEGKGATQDEAPKTTTIEKERIRRALEAGDLEAIFRMFEERQAYQGAWDQKKKGFTVYHGSPYDLTRFDADKIGTGEGNTTGWEWSYGNGIYLAENPKVAEWYRDELSSRVDLAGKPLSLNAAVTHISGHVYTVQVNRGQDEFLDWEKPLSRQSPYVIGKLVDIFGDEVKSSPVPGSQLLRDITGIWEVLRDVGIAGVRYLDAKSRADPNVSSATRNYVIFNPADADIQEKDGHPLDDGAMDEWTDEAREAALKARQAHKKAQPERHARLAAKAPEEHKQRVAKRDETKAKAKAEATQKPGIVAKGIAERDARVAEWQKDNPKTIDEHLEKSEANQKELISHLKEVGDELGLKVEDPGPKGKDSLEKKTASRRTPEQVVDAVRAGMELSNPGQADKVLAHLAKTYPVAQEGWQKTRDGYFDHKAAIRMGNGQIAEMQFWPPGMLQAKTEGHKMYEKHRMMQDKTAPEAIALQQQMQELYGKVEAGLAPEWKTLFAR